MSAADVSKKFFVACNIKYEKCCCYCHALPPLSWMGLFGAKSMKRSMSFGNSHLGKYFAWVERNL